MLPNVYGFSWTPVHLIFLTIFFSVATIVVGTVLLAAWRARRDLHTGRATAIQWHSAFEDLPARDRACRHEFTGEFAHRSCDRGFDCRECTQHAALTLRSRPQPGSSDEEIRGLSYPEGRMYHRGHTWVQPEPDGTVLIGPDELARRMFGRLRLVELPAPGSTVEVNGTAWTIRQRNDEFRVPCPVDGEIVERGGPDSGFYLRVRPTGDQAKRFVHLLRGAEVAPWVTRELERMQMLISPDDTLPSLADGGVLVDDVPAMFPEADWPAVWGEMLLEP